MTNKEPCRITDEFVPNILDEDYCEEEMTADELYDMECNEADKCNDYLAG